MVAKNRIRYKYKKVKEGVQLKDINCPICGSNFINFFKVIEHISWSGHIGLLAECWSGDIYSQKPKHLFRIRINGDNLPEVYINITKDKKKGEKKDGY